MVSSEQQSTICERVQLVVETFLSNPGITINELSELIGIPKSTIQRDLNDADRIAEVCGNPIDTLRKRKRRLTTNSIEGKSKGGTKYSINNTPIKLDNGKFCGSTRLSKLYYLLFFYRNATIIKVIL